MHDTVISLSQPKCPYCNGSHPGVCPRIKVIEYYPNGTIKSVELRDD